METMTGVLRSSWSEKTNGAPVLVSIETERGMESIPFDRQCWNRFFYDHVREDGVFPKDLTVQVVGESIWECSIACTDPDCPNCQPSLVAGSRQKPQAMSCGGTRSHG